jgi:hypothetical protein
MDYFSDQEIGPKPRIREEIPPSVWGGIVTAIERLILTGAFGQYFPETCPDNGSVVIGTDTRAMSNAVKAEIPSIAWPLRTTVRQQDGWNTEEVPFAPNVLDVLDLIQFCYVHLANPVVDTYHSFFQHYHLRFSEGNANKTEFREKINRIFLRNGIVYELQEDGSITRLAPPVLIEGLVAVVISSGDSVLDRMLGEARTKFLNPNPSVRREALEKLWDVWERLKTLEDPTDKKKSVSLLLDKAADEPSFRTVLEEEATKLTNIGNSFHIRHFEVGKTEIEDSSQIDHLFHRMFSMIWLLLRARSW